MASCVTPEEHRRALKFCNEHLERAWRRVSTPEVEVSRLCGGMTNLLYRCKLRDDVRCDIDEPREVLLRIYGPTPRDEQLELEIFRKLANEKLGPSLIKAFDGGRFEQYLPSNALTWEQMTDDKISAVVAKKIAAIHKLRVDCLDKRPDWLQRQFHEIHKSISSVDKNSVFLSDDTRSSTRAIASMLLDIDFKPEIEYLEGLIQASNDPLVFSHNDLHQNNIILMESTGQALDDRIVLIDFEYCSYNYRSFDIANHLSEWCFQYCVEEYPYFAASIDRLPSEERQRQFLKNYISEMGDTLRLSEQSNGNRNGLDPTDLLLRQIQPFFMASNFLWAIWAVKSACTSKIEFGYWEMAKWKWDVYVHCKQNYMRNAGDDKNRTLQFSRM